MSDLNRLADLLLPGIRNAQLKLEEVSNYLSAMPNSLRHYDGWQPIETAPEDGKPYEPKLAPAQYWEAQADMWHQNYKEAADEIERLRDALQFYASKNNYEKKKVWTTTFPQYEPDGYKIVTPVLSDNGEKARAAFQQKESE